MKKFKQNTREVYPGQDKFQLRKGGSYQNHPGHSKILIVPLKKVTTSRNTEKVETPLQ
jgi:hypothetical protein